MATGSECALLIDHKSGGTGQGLGPYWPQLSFYAKLVNNVFPAYTLKGVGVFWLDHGQLEIMDFG